MYARKADATGRSAKIVKLGMIKKWEPETPFMLHSMSLRESASFRSLTLAARKVLDFLELEHLRNAGRENGNLAAPYRQLEDLGISKRDVPKAVTMLKAFGLIVRTNGDFRLGGHKNMARYRLTYLPDMNGYLPTDDWRAISQADVFAFKSDRKVHPG